MELSLLAETATSCVPTKEREVTVPKCTSLMTPLRRSFSRSHTDRCPPELPETSSGSPSRRKLRQVTGESCEKRSTDWSNLISCRCMDPSISPIAMTSVEGDCSRESTGEPQPPNSYTRMFFLMFHSCRDPW